MIVFATRKTSLNMRLQNHWLKDFYNVSLLVLLILLVRFLNRGTGSDR